MIVYLKLIFKYMKILLPKIVEKDLLKLVLSKKSILILMEKIKKQNIEEIYLKRPFVKIKISIFWLTLRIIWEYRKMSWNLVLVLIIKKTNKKYWENLIWSKEIENKVINILPKISDDIKNNKYIIY